MQFLVKIRSHLPTDYPADKRRLMLEAEQARTRELHDKGALLATWRMPADDETISLWEAQDAGQLHGWLMSLPAMPWADAHVQPVIDRNSMA
jgi:muconolactone delta-isomerase